MVWVETKREFYKRCDLLSRVLASNINSGSENYEIICMVMKNSILLIVVVIAHCVELQRKKIVAPLEALRFLL